MWFTIERTTIHDCFLITPQVFGDERGFFMETYHRDAFAQAGIDAVFIQDNHSKSKKWVLRWFHYQTQNTQAKLVRVVAGSVLDIAIDMRIQSSTFGTYVIVELSATNKQQLFVPKGFAHGFLTLEDDTEFVYKCDDVYAPAYDSGIIYSDPDIGIDRVDIIQQYNISELIISDKDKHLQTLAEYKQHPAF